MCVSDRVFDGALLFALGLAGVLAILVILTALPAQVLFNLERKAFTTETYQQAFANDDFYARLPSILAESVHTASTQDLPVAMQGLSKENWEAFFRDLLPPDYPKGQPLVKVAGSGAASDTLALHDRAEPLARSHKISLLVAQV